MHRYTENTERPECEKSTISVVKIADDRDIVQSCIVASEGSDQIDFPIVSNAGYRSIVINIRIWRIVEKGSRKMSKIWRVDNRLLFIVAMEVGEI